MRKPKMSKLAPAAPPQPQQVPLSALPLDQRVALLQDCVGALIDVVGPERVMAQVRATQKARVDATRAAVEAAKAKEP